MDLQLKKESETIDGLDVTTQQLPAMRSFALLAKLGKVLAPVLGALKEGKFNLESDVAELAPFLGEAFAALDGEGAEMMAEMILASTAVIRDGKLVELNRTTIDLVFTGRMLTMLKVIAFALRVNYGEFFGGALSLDRSAPAEEPKRSS